MLTTLDVFFRRELAALLSLYVLAWVLTVLALGFAMVVFARAYLKYRGKRVITCPETEQYAAVDLDTLHAAFTALFHAPDLRLSSCTRWPERQDCAQDCIRQIEVSPIGCRVREMLTAWYRGKECVYCHRTFTQIHWADHKPALLDLSGKIVEWGSLRPEAVSEVLFTHKPVCWECKVVEGFRSKNSALVVERPWRH